MGKHFLTSETLFTERALIAHPNFSPGLSGKITEKHSLLGDLFCDIINPPYLRQTEIYLEAR